MEVQDMIGARVEATPEKTEDLRRKLRDELEADPYFGELVRFTFERMPDLRGREVLDMGCGDGVVTPLFAFEGARVVGLDRRKGALGRARTRADGLGVGASCRFVHGASEAMPFDDASFDVVFSRSTLQYMNRARAIDEAFRVLKPGGTLVLIENLALNPFVNVYRALRSRTRDPEEQRYARSILGYLTWREIASVEGRLVDPRLDVSHVLRPLTIQAVSHGPHAAAWDVADAIAVATDRALLHLPLARRLAWFVGLVGRKRGADDRLAGSSGATGERRTGCDS